MTPETIANQFPTTFRMLEDLTKGMHPAQPRYYLSPGYSAGLNLFAEDLEPEQSLLSRFFGYFSRDEEEARLSIKEIYKQIKDARDALEKSEESVFQSIFGSKPSLPEDDFQLLLIDYFAEGKCKTRLGDEICFPADDANDRSLYILLGTVRIAIEHYFNHEHPDKLPWVAGDQSDDRKQYKEYGRKASELGEKTGSAIGRAAAVSAVTLINPIASLPDEATIAISYIAGVIGRKVAEMKMHEYLMRPQ